MHALAEPRVRAQERLVLLLGAAVGEVALHEDGVGIERFDLVDRAAVHDLGVRRLAGSDVKTGPELLGRTEHAALELAEVHVVHGRERRQQRPGGLRQAS